MQYGYSTKRIAPLVTDSTSAWRNEDINVTGSYEIQISCREYILLKLCPSTVYSFRVTGGRYSTIDCSRDVEEPDPHTNWHLKIFRDPNRWGTIELSNSLDPLLSGRCSVKEEESEIDRSEKCSLIHLAQQMKDTQKRFHAVLDMWNSQPDYNTWRVYL